MSKRNAITICLANQKGGVGKTTTSVNLAAGLCNLKKKVLLIDLDPQGNTTSASGLNKSELEFSCRDLLLEQCDVETATNKTEFKYDIIGGNRNLSEIDNHTSNMPIGISSLKTKINSCKKLYDFILIDSPPSLNLLTMNALYASEYVVIPTQCEYYALEGLCDLTQIINDLKSNVPFCKTDILGIIRTMVDHRNKLYFDVSQQLREAFPNKVFQTEIPRNIKLAEAPSFAKPGIAYDPSSKGADAYQRLARELCLFIKQRQKQDQKESELEIV